MSNGISNERTFPFRLVANHGFPANRIRQLIKDALSPLPIDPVPKSIVIKNIVINQVNRTNLEISCEVVYGY